MSIGFSLLLLSTINSLLMFYVAFVIMGLGTSACTGSVWVPALANWFKRDYGKALGIMASGFGLGGVLIPLITYLINIYHWRTAFAILGFGMWLVGVPLSLVVRGNPEAHGYLLDGEKADTAAPPSQPREKDKGLREAIRARVFWHVSIAEAIRLMIATTVMTHVMPYLSTLGMVQSKAALVTTCIPLLSIIGRIGFGWLGDRFNRAYLMATVYSLSALGIAAFAYADTAVFIFPFLLFFPLSFGAGPLRAGIVRAGFGRASLGTLIGIMGGIGTFARMLGPSVAGWTYDTFGSYRPLWLVYAGIFGIGVLLMLTIKSGSKE